MPLFGSLVHRLDVVDSTNNYANHLIEQNLAVHGTIVVANYQTQGKGLRGKTWIADKGMNLTCSFLYFPDNLSVNQVHLLNYWISLNVLSMLMKNGIEARVKWPNDLWVGTKKIAGILTEITAQGTSVKSAIIGVGLNVNQTQFPELNATSMLQETGSPFILAEILQEICFLLNEHPLESIHEDLWKSNYENRLFGRFRRMKFIEEGRSFEGEIQGVSDQGFLQILVGEELRSYVQGSLSFEIPTEF